MFDSVELLEKGRKWAGGDPTVCSDDELLEAALAVTRHRSYMDAARAHILAELDARGLTDRDHGLPTAAWIAHETECHVVPLREDLKLGRALRTKLPEVDEALSTGQISSAHARVLADAVRNPRITDEIVDLQGELLHAADGCSFTRWRAGIREEVQLLDQDGSYDPHQDLTNNKLRMSPGLDGMWKLDAQFTAGLGEVLHQQIEAKADELFRRYTAEAALCPDLEVPPRATLLAEALTELALQGFAVDLHTTVAPRVAASFVVPAEHPGQAHDNHGVRLADGSVRVLLCDADWYTFVVNSLGVPLDAGRMARFALPHQRRAIAIRDGGCVFPGCEHPISWCDFHHTVGFTHDGGETNLNELAPLCRRHHGVVHRKGWAMHATDDGWFWFQGPSGRKSWSQRHQRQRPDAPPFPEPPT